MSQKDDKQAAIIKAAVTVFYRVGFEAASMADIAEEANVAKGTLYLYFTSKEQLIEAAFWHCHRENIQACDRGLEELEGAIAKLCQRLKNATRWALEHPAQSQVDRMALALSHGKRGVRYTSQYMHFERVDPIFREGIESGELKRLPTPLMGEMFFGIGGAALYYLMENPQEMENQAFWNAMDECIAGCFRNTEKS